MLDRDAVFSTEVPLTEQEENLTRFWGKPISNYSAKCAIAEFIASNLFKDEVIGAGSGTTSFLTLAAIAQKQARSKQKNIFVPTSDEITLACRFFGLHQTSPLSMSPDWGFDGADEIDLEGSMIKGRGGALVLEKIIMSMSKKTLIVADSSKFQERLGATFSVPVEIIPDSYSLVRSQLENEGISEFKLRGNSRSDGPAVTRYGNWTIDVRFEAPTRESLRYLKQIPGVIEAGLFFDYPIEIVRAN